MVKWDELQDLCAGVNQKKSIVCLSSTIFCQNQSVSVGDTWEIQHDGVLELIKQLHPKPNLICTLNSGDSNGLWACLQSL